jgi:acyl phosphate:glycerol-3-phosphate acyltransferase
MLIPLLIAAVVGYFLGALPFGFLVARAHGVNIFEAGSKNPGATNVKRVLGPKAGHTVFALDALKGAVATGWPALWSLCARSLGEHLVYVQIAGIVGALLGHSFSCFTRFKGGKGVATGAGGFLVLVPLPTLIGGAVWVVTFYATRYVSLASILAALAVPAAAWALGQPLIVLLVATAVGLFVVFRHRANLVRLCKGTEHRFIKQPAPAK